MKQHSSQQHRNIMDPDHHFRHKLRHYEGVMNMTQSPSLLRAWNPPVTHGNPSRIIIKRDTSIKHGKLYIQTLIASAVFAKAFIKQKHLKHILVEKTSVWASFRHTPNPNTDTKYQGLLGNVRGLCQQRQPDTASTHPSPIIHLQDK